VSKGNHINQILGIKINPNFLGNMYNLVMFFCFNLNPNCRAVAIVCRIDEQSGTYLRKDYILDLRESMAGLKTNVG